MKKLLTGKNLEIEVTLDGTPIGVACHVGGDLWEVHREPSESEPWVTVDGLDEVIYKLLYNAMPGVVAKKYTFIKNHLDSNASFDGCLFETFGQEVEFIKQQNTKQVWTLVEEDGEEAIIAGFHFVNRLGYFLTKEQWEHETEVTHL